MVNLPRPKGPYRIEPTGVAGYDGTYYEVLSAPESERASFGYIITEPIHKDLAETIRDALNSKGAYGVAGERSQEHYPDPDPARRKFDNADRLPRFFLRGRSDHAEEPTPEAARKDAAELRAKGMRYPLWITREELVEEVP